MSITDSVPRSANHPSLIHSLLGCGRTGGPSLCLGLLAFPTAASAAKGTPQCPLAGQGKGLWSGKLREKHRSSHLTSWDGAKARSSFL